VPLANTFVVGRISAIRYRSIFDKTDKSVLTKINRFRLKKQGHSSDFTLSVKTLLRGDRRMIPDKVVAAI